MIPNTAVGLLILVGLLGPGYVWVTFTERRRLRPDRSGVLEAADVVIVGTWATVLAVAALLVIAEMWDWFPTLPELFSDAKGFANRYPYRITLWALAVFTLSVGGTRLAAWLLFRRTSPQIHPESTVWYETFRLAQKKHVVLVKIELNDGRRIEGVFSSYLMDRDLAEKDVALRAPIRVVSAPAADGSRMWMDHRAHRVIIPGSEIATVWVYYTWLAGPMPSIKLANQPEVSA